MQTSQAEGFHLANMVVDSSMVVDILNETTASLSNMVSEIAADCGMVAIFITTNAQSTAHVVDNETTPKAPYKEIKDIKAKVNDQGSAL
jgi:hypothetical protein